MKRIVCASLAIGFVLAQDSPPDPRTLHNQVQQSDEQPTSEPPSAGPSVLGRNTTAPGKQTGKLLDFRFYAEISGVYDSGLTPVTNAQATPTGASGYGLETGVGFVGTERWKQDQLSVEYRGRFRDYAGDALFNGADQFLDLAYRHEIDRHLTLDVKETAGSTTLANGEFAYLPITNAAIFAIPANELFDNRTNYSESQADLTWDKTAQLSFEVGGEGFVVRRDSAALAGLNGYSVHAAASYRLTRRQTISAVFKFTNFDFQRTFGNATLESALEYSIALNRNMDLTLQAGGSRVDTRGLTDVSLDPAIAAIIGENVAVVTFSRVVYIPELQAKLTQRFQRSSLRLVFFDGVSPGNGVYLTSRQTTATMGYSYIGYRRVTLAAHGGYNQLSTIGQSLGKYTDFEAGGAVTYEIARGTRLELHYDYRYYTTADLFYRKNSNRVSLGLVYGPDAPLPVW